MNADARPPRLLNLGCGGRFHADWVNADMAPAAPEVLAVDLAGELPFPAASFDAVYCSHVLEHLRPEAVPPLLRRIHGLLRPGGILRVVVPDLEAMARVYLDLLAELERDPQAREADYDWILLELYDQAARSESGGAMLGFAADPQLRNAAFVRSRIGAEARRAYDEGLFRQSGELHRWMYDRYSLARALRRAGFADPARQTAFESRIPGFARYQLDVDAGGEVRKPDSLFMEARA